MLVVQVQTIKSNKMLVQLSENDLIESFYLRIEETN